MLMDVLNKAVTVAMLSFVVSSVPIRLAQTHTICSGGDPKNQGFKEL
jgi:hypothetical protein